MAIEHLGRFLAGVVGGQGGQGREHLQHVGGRPRAQPVLPARDDPVGEDAGGPIDGLFHVGQGPDGAAAVGAEDGDDRLDRLFQEQVAGA